MWMTCGHWDGMIGGFGTQQGNPLPNSIIWEYKTHPVKVKDQIRDKGHMLGPHFTQHMG